MNTMLLGVGGVFMVTASILVTAMAAAAALVLGLSIVLTHR